MAATDLPKLFPPLLFFLLLLSSSTSNSAPTPTPWPLQFHSILFVNYSGSLSLIDLWYDWPNGRNFNIIQDQLGGPPLYDLEWNNGTSFFYTLQGSPSPTCRTAHLDVGILRPNWLDGANYLGREMVDGFLCDVWEKVEFIWYYEDVVTKRPVHWIFYTGRSIHVMTFEVGAVLEDAKWQAPVYCFDKGEEENSESQSIISELFRMGLMQKSSVDLERNNCTSFAYTLSSPFSCSTFHFDIGILRPNWLDDATYLGQEMVDVFLCNVWEKVEFIWYYEDAVTKRAIHWVFYTGRSAHAMTFEVGAVLENAKWQAPVYCFEWGEEENPEPKSMISEIYEGGLIQEVSERLWGFISILHYVTRR